MGRVVEWRPVPRTEGYEVSNAGEVRSVRRSVVTRAGQRRMTGGRVLRQFTDERGYRTLQTGAGPTRYVHVLVCEAFHGPRPVGHEACHRNGDHGDNRDVNLRWGTSAENKRDTIEHGRHRKVQTLRCPSEHLLVEPNITAAARRRGHRSCQSCHLGRCRASTRPGSDWRELAHAAYREMGVE